MRLAGLLFFLALPSLGRTQGFSLQVQPVFSGEKIEPGQYFRDENGDSLLISALKFYLGNFEFRKNGLLVFADNTHHLFDLEDEAALQLNFHVPGSLDFDSLAFDLGVDSLTTAAGAMGGDLDPTRGMFWTWQSGYINVKIEGFSSKCPSRTGSFEFHLGGYLHPYRAVRRVALPFSKVENVRLDFELAPFFQQVDWQKKPSIMSPGAAAMRLMGVLATCFLMSPNG